MKKVLFSVLIVFMIFLTAGCVKSNKVNSEITSFSYNYGSYNGGYYDYSITVDNDNKATFVASGYNGVDLSVNKTIDSSYVEELAKIINKKKIYNWNNFKKSDSGVMDGYSFSLNVKYKNGETIKANGYMKYPMGYKSGHKALVKFLGSIK